MTEGVYAEGLQTLVLQRLDKLIAERDQHVFEKQYEFKTNIIKYKCV